MLNLVPDTQSDVIKAFNTTSRYLDDILNIDNPFFASLVNTIYPKELQLNKANKGDTVASVFSSTGQRPAQLMGWHVVRRLSSVVPPSVFVIVIIENNSYHLVTTLAGRFMNESFIIR